MPLKLQKHFVFCLFNKLLNHKTLSTYIENCQDVKTIDFIRYDLFIYFENYDVNCFAVMVG